jgi:hypothetical protein
MSQAQLRRLARLENLASAYIQRHHLQQDDGHGADRELDFIKVANIAILVRYGDPHIGEPLRSAWQRCLQSPAWRALRAERPDALVIRDYNQEATPFSEAGARVLAEYFRRWILPDLSGADATEKLNRLLSKTPPWLLWFTHGDTAGIVLGLKVPDPFDRRRYARPSGGKPYLPEESFAWRLLPDGRDDEFLGGVLELERKHLASLEIAHTAATAARGKIPAMGKGASTSARRSHERQTEQSRFVAAGAAVQRLEPPLSTSSRSTVTAWRDDGSKKLIT